MGRANVDTTLHVYVPAGRGESQTRPARHGAIALLELASAAVIHEVDTRIDTLDADRASAGERNTAEERTTRTDTRKSSDERNRADGKEYRLSKARGSGFAIGSMK